MIPLFLSDAELLDLTGYRRNADRCRWLEARHWKFEKSATTGKPVVSRSYAESQLSGIPVKVEPKLNLAWAKR